MCFSSPKIDAPAPAPATTSEATPPPTPAPAPSPTPSQASPMVAGQRRKAIQELRRGFQSTIRTGPQGTQTAERLRAPASYGAIMYGEKEKLGA